MKKIICLILILGFSGFVFFLGWTQIKVKADTIGIVQSKTGGISKNIIIPGKFSWHKEFLLPTNAITKTFTDKPHNSTKTISGKTSFKAKEDNQLYNLDYSFSYSLTITLSPESILSLYEKKSISSDEDLSKFLENCSEYICQQATSYFIQKYQENNLFNPHTIQREELIRTIKIYNDYPELDLTVIALNDYKINKIPVIPEVQIVDKLPATNSEPVQQNQQTAQTSTTTPTQNNTQGN